MEQLRFYNNRMQLIKLVSSNYCLYIMSIINVQAENSIISIIISIIRFLTEREKQSILHLYRL